MSKDFLPPDYKVPQTDGNYMKLKDGENLFRILSPSIRGWELWVDGKPERSKEDEEISIEKYESADLDERTGEPRPARHFMAFVVWNYNAEPKAKLQILEITQKGIKDKLTNLNRTKAWGNPVGTDGYDLVITRTKTGPSQWDVEYDTIPNPKEKLSKDILDAYKAADIKIEALFEGEDPFGSEEIDPDDVEKALT